MMKATARILSLFLLLLSARPTPAQETKKIVLADFTHKSVMASVVPPESRLLGENCNSSAQAVIGVNFTDGPASGLGCHNCSLNAQNADWFVYMATMPGFIGVSSCGRGIDTRLWIYESDSPSCHHMAYLTGSDDDCEISPGGDGFASQAGFFVCPGKFYFLEWDDQWDDSGFTFELSFTSAFDYELLLTDVHFTEYTQMPLSSAAIGMRLVDRNIGAHAMSNVQIHFALEKEGDTVADFTQQIHGALPMCATDTFTCADSVFLWQRGAYTAHAHLFADEVEALVANNYVGYDFLVDTTFARDDGNIFAGFGIGDGQGGTLGHNFTLRQPDVLTTVSFRLVNGYKPGNITRIDIYSTDASGMPLTLLGSTVDKTLTPADTGLLTLPLAGAYLNLPAGEYYFGIVETTDFISLAVTPANYTPHKMWFKGPMSANAWVHLEDFDVRDIAFVIRPNFGKTYPWASIDSPEELGISIAPNPSQGIFYITLNTLQNAMMRITDAQGRLIKSEYIPAVYSTNYNMDLSAFPVGLYTLQIVSDNKMWYQKIVISR